MKFSYRASALPMVLGARSTTPPEFPNLSPCTFVAKLVSFPKLPTHCHPTTKDIERLEHKAVNPWPKLNVIQFSKNGANG